MLATDYPFLDLMWTMVIFFLWILWIWLLFSVFADIFRRDDLSGWGKTAWILFVILLPFLGVFVYLITQNVGMTERKLQRSRAERDRFDQSGLWLNQEGDALRVMDVIPGAPGERAGVRVGERVVAVDGAPIAEGSLVSLRERFRTETPGSEVRLRVVGEDGAAREVVLVLAELV